MSPEPWRLDGRIALVTGGSAGIGLGIAKALAAAGARVVVTGRREPEGQAAAAEVGAAGGEALFLPQDATREEDWTGVLDRIASDSGRLDLLVNNVGLNSLRPLAETDAAWLDRLLRLNLHATFLGMTLGGRMIAAGARGGAILNIASMAAHYGHAECAPYAAAKAAVVALTKAAAEEYGRSGIRVNVVSPGIFPTPLAEASAFPTEAHRAAQLARIPYGRFGDVAELGAVARFLLSDAASAITGAEFLVDAGRTLL